MPLLLRIREIRESRQLTQTELARRLGVDRSYLSKIEDGARLQPALRILAHLADHLDCSIADLFAPAAGSRWR
jgi:transcriptional regulator with XRE-family HTH domain